MINPGLENHVVLVTGANAGIGAQVAREFAAHGATIVIHYLEEAMPVSDAGISVEHAVPGREAANAVLEEIRAIGANGIAVAADLSVPGEIPRLFDMAEQLGPVSVLVNNAAHCESPDDLRHATANGLARHFLVNAQAPTILMREFANRYERRGDSRGSIINISTDAARAFANQIGYGASKAALEALTRSVAIELGPLGITVNAVAPGPVQTGWMTEELQESVLQSIPMRRVGTPADIAQAVVFFASQQARWITGQVLQVAGGHAL